MAAVELPEKCEKMLSETESGTSSRESETSPDFERNVDCAREALLMRDFERCHKLCLKGITRSKQYPESVRAQQGTEQLCVLCIQALAELNQWQEVLPLVQKVYSGVEACPHTIIKLCILLYAKVEEFSQCHAITSVWLRCEDNSRKTGYAEVASLYIDQVMVPQGRHNLVPQFLDSCTVLDTNVKQKLLENLGSTGKDDTCDKTSLETAGSSICSGESDRDQCTKEEDPATDIYAVVLSQIKAAASLIASKLAYPSVRILLKIAAMAVGLYLMFQMSFNGDFVTGAGRTAAIWQTVLTTFKSIFTPYKPAR